MPLVPRETLGRISVFSGLKWRPSGFLPVSRQITSPYCPSLASCIGQGEQRCLPLDCVRVKCHIHLLGSVSVREDRARHHPHAGESKGPSTFLGCRVHALSRKHSSKITHYLLSGKSKTRQTWSLRGGQSLGTSSTCGEGRDRVGGRWGIWVKVELWLVAKTWAQVGFVKSGSITKMSPKMHCLYSCGSEMEEVGFQE